MDTKLDKVLNDSERLSSLKLHYPLIPWPTWSCDNFKKSYISTITRCMGSKSGKVLTYGRKFPHRILAAFPCETKSFANANSFSFSFSFWSTCLLALTKVVFQISPIASLVRMTSIWWTEAKAFGVFLFSN